MTNLSTTAGLLSDTALKDVLMEKMKVAFIETIPTEKLEALMTSAFDEFLHGPRVYRFKKIEKRLASYDTGYDETPGAENIKRWEEPINPPTIVTNGGRDSIPYVVTQDKNTLPGMIYAMLHDFAKRKAEAIFAGPEYQGDKDWQTQQVTFVEGVVKQYLEENSAVLVQSLFANIVQNAMSSTLQNIRNNASNTGIYR